MRHRKSNRGLSLSRIYIKGNRYYLFARDPIQNPDTGKIAKWHSLCAVSQGEEKAREIARRITQPAGKHGLGSMPQRIEEYRITVLKRREQRRPREPARVKMFDAANTELARICGVIAVAFEDFNPDQILPMDVAAFVDQWAGKRMAQVYRARLSDFFAWACRLGYATSNPVRDVTVERPAKRARYLTDAEYHAIRDALATGADGRETASGAMVQCYMDLCYLLYQRTTEIRLLKWSDIDLSASMIVFKPTKTEHSSGARVSVPISPAAREVIERARTVGVVKSMYVIHNLRGQPYDHHGLGTAWKRACKRAGVEDAILKDLRAKAATDAKRAGYQTEQVQVGLAHTDAGMTEHYIRQRETPVSEILMTLPNRANA